MQRAPVHTEETRLCLWTQMWRLNAMMMHAIANIPAPGRAGLPHRASHDFLHSGKQNTMLGLVLRNGRIGWLWLHLSTPGFVFSPGLFGVERVTLILLWTDGGFWRQQSLQACLACFKGMVDGGLTEWLFFVSFVFAKPSPLAASYSAFNGSCCDSYVF